MKDDNGAGSTLSMLFLNQENICSNLDMKWESMLSVIYQRKSYLLRNINTSLVYFLCFYDSLLCRSTQLMSSYTPINRFLITNIL